MLITLGLWRLRREEQGFKASLGYTKIYKTKQVKSPNKTNSLESLKLA